MKTIRILVLSTSASALLVFQHLALAGFSAEKLAQAGYFCTNAGPSNWMHCFKLEHLGNPAIPVKVFSEDGSAFLGTEQLMHESVYVDKPCPQDGLSEWEPNADLPGYFACHHFHTEHH